MGKRKKFFRAVAEGIVALSVAFNFVSCGKKTKTEATVLSLGISADDEAAEADMGNIVPFENIRVLLAEDNELNKRNCFGPSARKRDRSGVRRERKTGLRYVFCA